MLKKTTKSQRAVEKRPSREPRSGAPRTGAGPRVSSSWGRSPGIERSGSWSEELEEAASRRVLEHWRLLERTLHEEDGQLPPGPLHDECQQWRIQLAHLRIVGQAASESTPEAAGSSARASSLSARESFCNGHSLEEFADLEPAFFSKEASFQSFNQQSQKQTKEEVLEHIVEYICRELAELEAEKLAEEEEEEADEGEIGLSSSFNECLKIAAAPTCTGKEPLASNGFHHKLETMDTTDEPRVNEQREPRARRNKLGTVFNERVIVSPVPYVVTMRQSFSTLRKTPILYAGENSNGPLDILRSGSRRENTRRKLSLTGKSALMATAHVQQSSWNTPVCPTIWPKNVKLTPIDTSRLPSSKKRSSKTAESLPPRRNRHSLSPISPSVQPIAPHSCSRKDNHLASLQVHGSQIIAQERIWHARNTAKTANIGSNLCVPERQV